MRILREAFARFGAFDRCLYTRTVMANLYFPHDTTSHKFVAKIPVDEGVADVDDFDIILDKDCKSIVIIAKKKPTITIDESVPARLSPIPASPLDEVSPSFSVLDSQLR